MGKRTQRYDYQSAFNDLAKNGVEHLGGDVVYIHSWARTREYGLSKAKYTISTTYNKVKDAVRAEIAAQTTNLQAQEAQLNKELAPLTVEQLPTVLQQTSGYQELAQLFFDFKSQISFRSQLANAKKAEKDGSFVYSLSGTKSKSITQEQRAGLMAFNWKQLTRAAEGIIEQDKNMSEEIRNRAETRIKSYIEANTTKKGTMAMTNKTRAPGGKSVHTDIGELFEMMFAGQEFSLGKGDFTVSFENVSANTQFGKQNYYNKTDTLMHIKHSGKIVATVALSDKTGMQTYLSKLKQMGDNWTATLNHIPQFTATINAKSFEWDTPSDLSVPGMDADMSNIARYVNYNARTKQDVEIKKLLAALQVAGHIVNEITGTLTQGNGRTGLISDLPLFIRHPSGFYRTLPLLQQIYDAVESPNQIISADYVVQNRLQSYLAITRVSAENSKSLRKVKQKYMGLHKTTTYNDLLNDAEVRAELQRIGDIIPNSKKSMTVSLRIKLNNIK